MNDWEANVVRVDEVLEFHYWHTGICHIEGYEAQELKTTVGSFSIMGSVANLPLLF